MKLYYTTLDGADNARRVTTELLNRSQYYQIEPMPDDWYSVAVKDENRDLIDSLVHSNGAEDGANNNQPAAEHTPGPWKAKQIERARDGYIQKLIGYQVTAQTEHGEAVVCEAYPAPWSVIVSEANANLMAAAPDLLDALTQMQVALGDFCCDNCISHDDMANDHPEMLKASQLADAVIAKAKGNNRCNAG